MSIFGNFASILLSRLTHFMILTLFVQTEDMQKVFCFITRLAELILRGYTHNTLTFAEIMKRLSTLIPIITVLFQLNEARIGNKCCLMDI